MLPMTPEQRRHFGVSAAQESELAAWIHDRMGVVLGSDGRGGSGVFVETQDGAVALLTAKHVVGHCIGSGELTVSHAGRSAARSFSPAAIKIDARCDAALLILSSAERPVSWIPWASVDPSAGRDVAKDSPIVCCGVPGLLKSTPDIPDRSVKRTVFLQYWTGVEQPIDVRGLIACSIGERPPELTSMRGMSGGPAFGINKALLGISVVETDLETPEWCLRVLPRRALTNLFSSYAPPLESPCDYTIQQGHLELDGKEVCRPGPLQRLRIGVHAEFFRSLSRPDDPLGRVGRITGIEFELDRGRYPLNVESVFEVGVDGPDGQIRAIKAELQLILQSL